MSRPAFDRIPGVRVRYVDGDEYAEARAVVNVHKAAPHTRFHVLEWDGGATGFEIHRDCVDHPSVFLPIGRREGIRPESDPYWASSGILVMLSPV